MALPITIKPIGATEITPLTQLSIKTFHDAFMHLNRAEDVHAYMNATFNEENLLQEIKQPDSYFYFALVDEEPAGYIKLNFNNSQTEMQEPGGMEIQRLYVSAKYQGQKLGEQLIQFAVSRAKEFSCLYVWLGVWDHNLNAIRFYERHGFAIFSQHDFWLGAELQTDLLMKKTI